MRGGAATSSEFWHHSLKKIKPCAAFVTRSRFQKIRTKGPKRLNSLELFFERLRQKSPKFLSGGYFEPPEACVWKTHEKRARDRRTWKNQVIPTPEYFLSSKSVPQTHSSTSKLMLWPWWNSPEFKCQSLSKFSWPNHRKRGQLKLPTLACWVACSPWHPTLTAVTACTCPPAMPTCLVAAHRPDPACSFARGETAECKKHKQHNAKKITSIAVSLLLAEWTFAQWKKIKNKFKPRTGNCCMKQVLRWHDQKYLLSARQLLTHWWTTHWLIVTFDVKVAKQKWTVIQCSETHMRAWTWRLRGLKWFQSSRSRARVFLNIKSQFIFVLRPWPRRSLWTNVLFINLLQQVLCRTNVYGCVIAKPFCAAVSSARFEFIFEFFSLHKCSLGWEGWHSNHLLRWYLQTGWRALMSPLAKGWVQLIVAK